MRSTSWIAILALLGAVLFTALGYAESPEEWIRLGTRLHGGFVALVPVGIRIGLDALERLKTAPGGVSVTFLTGEKAPCPCIADGVMLATRASPGQGTLQVAQSKAPSGLLAVVLIRDRKTGAGLRYRVSEGWAARIAEWNRNPDPLERYRAAMAAVGLFEVTEE